MLEMDEKRISFAESLRPPYGYRTAFVVGTTYTLDLRALLGICIPLGLGFEPEALERINPVSLFAALQSLQGKMVVFCDKGHMNTDIGGNDRSKGLAILLEDMIHQVHVNRWHPQRRRRCDGMSSFHPKVWIVEYEPIEEGKQRLFRMLVMSRNLTFDTSWDAAISIDGHLGMSNECSEHLAGFLEFLATGDQRTSTEKDNTRKRGSHTKRILQLAEDIRNVEFELTGNDFKGVDFLPFGPQHDAEDGKLLDAYESPLVTSSYRNLLVASPFLSDAKDSPLQLFVNHRGDSNGRFLLMSREDSLRHLSEGLRAQYDCFSPVTWLADVPLESDEDDAPDAANYSNLHAKIYFVEKWNSQRHLYIGSLNASRNGMVNNVEALLRLDVRSRHLYFNDVVQSFIGNEKKRGAFAPFVPMDDVAEIDEMAERFRRVFQASTKSIEFKSVTVSTSDGAYQLDVEANLLPALEESEQISYTLRPLLAAIPAEISISSKPDAVSLKFGPMKLEQVSSLFVLEGRDKEGNSASSVMACPRYRFNEGEATVEERSSALLSSILAAHDGSLYLYLAHAFGVAGPSQGDGQRTQQPGFGSTLHGGMSIAPALYEKLLEKAYSDPDTIQRAEYLIGLIPEGVADNEVKELKRLVDVFKKAVS